MLNLRSINRQEKWYDTFAKTQNRKKVLGGDDMI